MRTSNRVKHEDQYKLLVALQAAQAEIDRDNLTKRQLAERLTERLGFRVVARNLDTPAAAVGLKFRDPHGNGNVMAGVKARLDKLDADAAAIAGRLAFIEAQLGLVPKAGA